MFTSPPIRIAPPCLHSDSDVHFASNPNSTTPSPTRLRYSLRLQSEFHRHVSTPMFTSPPIRIPLPRLHSDCDVHFASNTNTTATSPLRVRCSPCLQFELHHHVSTPTRMFTMPPIRIPQHLSTPTPMFTLPPIRIPLPCLHSDSDSEFHRHVSTPTPMFTLPPNRIPLAPIRISPHVDQLRRRLLLVASETHTLEANGGTPANPDQELTRGREPAPSTVTALEARAPTLE
ncbi:UNVERIFIED_CONTAM: hypothetical protein K2H54_049152 [Gekko kuhli]